MNFASLIWNLNLELSLQDILLINCKHFVCFFVSLYFAQSFLWCTTDFLILCPIEYFFNLFQFFRIWLRFRVFFTVGLRSFLVNIWSWNQRKHTYSCVQKRIRKFKINVPKNLYTWTYVCANNLKTKADTKNYSESKMQKLNSNFHNLFHRSQWRAEKFWE